MSGTVIKEFLVMLGFETKGSELSSFNAGILEASKKAAVLGAAVIGAATAITAFVGTIANELDDLGELAARTDNSADAIDRLGFIAQQSDSSVAAVGASLEALSKNAGDASMGIGRAKLVFEKLGISVKDGNGKLKNSAALMAEIGNRVKGMEKGKANAALERLGIDRTMLKMLTTDVSKLGNAYDEMAKASGISMEDATKAGGEFMDSFDAMHLVLKRLSIAIASKFMRGMADGFRKFTAMIIENMPKIIAVITPIIATIMGVAQVFMFAAGMIIDGVSFILGGFSQLNDATGGVIGWITGLTVAVKLLMLAFNANPIGLLVGAIAGLVIGIGLLWDDLKTFQEGGKSFLPWEKWENEIKLFTDIVDNFKRGIGDSIGWIVDKMSLIPSLPNKLGTMMLGAEISPAPISAGGGASINQETTINVNGSADPAATGKAVAGAQNRTNADMARNMQSRAR